MVQRTIRDLLQKMFETRGSTGAPSEGERKGGDCPFSNDASRVPVDVSSLLLCPCLVTSLSYQCTNHSTDVTLFGLSTKVNRI